MFQANGATPNTGFLDKVAAMTDEQLPPDPGTSPVPEGHVRLWHYTPLGNVPSIREHGLQRRFARGDAGNGDLNDPSAGMWASTYPPEHLNHSEGHAAVVEFHAHPREISGNAESPWHAELKREPGQAWEDRRYDPDKLREWNEGHHHVIMHGDVPPEHILAIHEPWHHAARYMRNDDPTLQSYQWVKHDYAQGGNDHLEPYVRGLRALEAAVSRPATMSVEDLLNLHSNEALTRKRHFEGQSAEHGDDTRVSTVYDRKAAEMARNPGAWGQLDEPIRNGSIDPVLLAQTGSGHTVVSEGQHRIVRAHQLGVGRLPVSYDPGSQEHRYDWEEPEPLDEHTAAFLDHFEASGVDDYGMGHRPLHDGAPAHDLTEGYAEDIYTHPHYWAGAWPDKSSAEGLKQLREARGNPEHRVTIYRASPPGAPYKMHTGDWVSLSPSYAELHGYNEGDDEWHVHKAVVPAKHVRDAGTDQYREQGYWGPDIDTEHHSGPRPVTASAHQGASSDDYGILHRPDVGGPPLHDLTDSSDTDWGMPKDIYERMHEYNTYQHDPGLLGEAAYKAMGKIRKFRGQPEKKVRIWRSAPAVNPESRNGKRGEINHGDWVGLSREKALSESYEVNDPPHGSLPANHPQRYHIWSALVPAKHVRNADGDLTEWGYAGPDIKDIPHHSETCSHRARVKPREASMDKQAAGETAPEGHQIWAVPAEGRSPVAAEVYHNMTHREPEDEHGSAWYRGVSYHGPYHVIRHPQTRQVWLVDRHGRDASPTGGHYGNPEKDGNWGEQQAWSHQFGLESAGPEAHRFSTPDEPKLNEMDKRVPEFPHSRVDPEDEERVRRPAPRVHAPEGHSPSDEYHGSYEVVQHPETGRYHVVDNAGRSAHVLPLNGFGSQLQAERSRDYTEKSQRSKEIGRGVADAISRGGMEALDPGGTDESRQSDENLRTGSELMTRYEGGLGEIKFDDDRGGDPYYEREHLHPSGTPSGWYARHFGGPSAEMYHRATGDESHDLIRFPQHPEDEGRSMTPRLHPSFGDDDLAAKMRAWHDDSEGGMRERVEQDDPRIARWKRQHLGSIPAEPRRFFHGTSGTYSFQPGDVLTPEQSRLSHVYYTSHLPTAAYYATYGHPLNERGYQNLDAEAVPGHVYEVQPEDRNGKRIGRHAEDPMSGVPNNEQAYRTKSRLRVLHEVDRETGEPLPAARTAAVELVAHFEEPTTAAGPFFQQKLFHMQPDNTLHDPESMRHNPEDPEAGVRWRSEHDENYRPDECEHCGSDLNMPRKHAEEHEEWLGQQDWHTDWSAEGLPDTLHRGIGAPLPEHVHAVVHDASRPVHERARALVTHLLGEQNGGSSGVGNFWSSDPDVAKTYAESAGRRYNSRGYHGQQTPVMFHIHTPDMEHIETDPDTLQHWGVYSYHLAGNREVPISHQAPLRVKGISWAPPDHEVREPSPHDPAWHHPGPHRFDQDPAWTHHEFSGEGIQANASLATEVVAHFEEPHRDPSVLTAEDHARLSRIGDDEAHALDPTSDEHEFVWGFRQDRPHERMRQSQQLAEETRQHSHQECAARGHDMTWERGEGWGEPGRSQHFVGTCRNCGADMTAAASSTTSHRIGRMARDEDCAGPGTAWQNDLLIEHRQAKMQGAVERFQREVKDIHDRQWLKDQGLWTEGSLEPEQPRVPSFTWRYQTYGKGPEGGYVDEEQTVNGPFYHGSRSKGLRPGSQVKPGMRTNPWGDEGARSQRVHFTTNLDTARTYARDAGGHVYEVEPTGHVTMGYIGDEWKSEHPLNVIRRVPDDEEGPAMHTASTGDPDAIEVVAHFDAPGHAEFYHGEGSEDGPRTNALEEHLYGNGHGRSRWDTTVDEAINHAQQSAYNTPGTHAERRARYHERLEGIHANEHQHGAESGADPAELETGHHQQWRDEEAARFEHEHDVAHHLEMGSAHMHGQNVSFGEMTHHLVSQHGIPSDALPEHQLPESDYHDPYQAALEEMHEQHHGDHSLPANGTYRHTPEGQYVTMHWGPRTDFDAESHLVNHHGFDIDELRRDEPDLAAEHERDHAANRSHLDHHLYTVMDPEGHLPHSQYYSGPDADELREGDPEHHFEVRSRDEEGNEHHGIYHAEDEDHAREMHEDAHPWDEEPHHVGRAPVIPPRRQYTMEPGQHPGWEPPMGQLQAPSEAGVDHGTAHTWTPAEYRKPPRSREELWSHLQEHHGVSQSADSTKEPGQSFMLNLHDQFHSGAMPDDRGTVHQHDNPEGHDPVFGSAGARALVAHFGERGPAVPDPAARDTVLAERGIFGPLLEAIGAWQPQNQAEAVRGAAELDEVCEALREGLQHVARYLEELPLDPEVGEAVHEVVKAASALEQDFPRIARMLPTEASWETPGSSPNR